MRGGPTALTALAACVALAAGCTGEETDPSPTPSETPTESPTGTPSETPTAPESPSEPATPQGPPRVVGTLASGLQAPWGLAFLPDGSAVLTERDTQRVLLLDPPRRPREIGVVAIAEPYVEGGLLGVAVSPDFEQDRLLYFYATTAGDNRVLRARWDGGRLATPEPVLTGIPRGAIHDGGRLLFDDEGMLLVSTGETGQPGLAQDPSSLAGKILRITPDGDPAPGNPDPGSPVLTLGHRNVQGLAFDGAGRLWASEFGDSTFDELNRIEPGGNYGWPVHEGPGDDPAYVDPVRTWDTSQNSPSGLAFADGRLWLGALQGERLWSVPVDGRRTGRPRGYFLGEYGRIRTVVTAPDGTLWVTTSNRDGRGSPAAQDDRVLRVRP